MRHIATIAAAIALTGCASVGSLQADCERTNQTFPAAMSCLESKIAQDGRLSGNTDVKLYTLRARQLSQQVQAGEISDLDARVALQRLHVEIEDKRKAFVMADDDIAPSSKRIRATANCVSNGGYTNCTVR